MKTLLSTGLVFLFWFILGIGAVKFIIRRIVPRRVRRSFSKLWNFTLELVCSRIERQCKVVYTRYEKELKKRKESEEQSDDEDILEGLDSDTIKYNNAVAGYKATSSENVIVHDFKKKKKRASSK